MKKALKGLLAAVFAVSLVFGVVSCGGDNPSSPPSSKKGSGKYNGKDVLGNTYSLNVGTDASKAAKKDDRYSMTIKTRDGKTRTSKGKVKSVNKDGTVTLQTDNGEEFTAVVDGNSLDSVVGDDIPFTGTSADDNLAITPRTFDTIHLRANRWDNYNNPNVETADKSKGEQWASGTSILVTDFPTNVSKLEKDSEGNRYTITISGTSDTAIQYGVVEVQGIDADGNWKWFTSTLDQEADDNGYITVTAGSSFEKVIKLRVWDDYNLMEYKEVVLQFINELSYTRDQESDSDHNRNNGSLPSNINNGDIMATISDLKIVLRDTDKDALAGNMGDYHYGYQEDGLSIDYRQAVWSLSTENIAKAKVSGAKFEFFVTDFTGYNAAFEEDGPTLAFIWQDPNRGLWWQDMAEICGGVESKDWAFELRDGVEYDSYRHKISVDLSTVIKDNQFATASEVNFIVACWWNNWADDESGSVDELGIAGGNIVEAVPHITGNLGKYYWGDESVAAKAENRDPTDADDDYYLTNYKNIRWALSDDVKTLAQTDGATLELKFSKDLPNSNIGLILVWNDPSDNRWYPEESAQGEQGANLFIYKDGSAQNSATYNSATKTLTLPLSGIETYTDFKTADELILSIFCWWGPENLNDLGITHAAIIADGGFGEQSDGSYILDPAGFTEWYGATGAGTDTIAFTNGGVKYAWPTDFDITEYNSLEIQVKLTAYTGGTKGGLDVIVKTFNDTTWAPEDQTGGTNVKYSKLEGYEGGSPTVDTTYTLTINDEWNAGAESDGTGVSFEDLWHNATNANKGWGFAVNTDDTDRSFTLQFVSITFKP